MKTPIIKKSLIKFLSASLLLFFSAAAFASDFIVPNSSGEPVTIDVSNLNLISGIDVTIGDFPNQPRPYRDSSTKSLVIFPPAASDTERTIQVRAGSSSITKTISFRSSPPGTLKNSLLPELQDGRGGNTVTKISDGRVVLIGGSKGLADTSLDTIEIFDPQTGRSDFLKTADGLKTAKLKISRSQHTATYLGINNFPIGMISGTVEQILVIGGFSKDGVLANTIEIIEIKVGTNQSTSTLLTDTKSKLKKARIFHTASLLPDGRILIIGGQGHINMTALGALNTIEIFDPLTKTILPAGISLSTSRLLHTATTLQNGNILICGGFTNETQGSFGFGPGTNTAELIDVGNLAIKKVGSFVNNQGLGGHSATLLTNGLVLITGGSTDLFSSRSQDASKGLTLGTIQFYNSNNETFNAVTKSTGGNLTLQNPRFLHQSVLFPNGSLAVIGGLSIKEGSSSSALINTPVSTIEVFEPNLLTFSGGGLTSDQKPNIETSIGRIFPSSILVTPKNKTQGLLSTQDINNFTNAGIYITGGFTNGLGKLPSKVSELVQAISSNTIEGRSIKLTPEGLIRGSYLAQLLVELSEFSKVPSLKVEPQTINLSSANSFMSNIKVLSTNNEVVLLKAQTSDSVIVSPSLFQVGDDVSISRKDSSVQGQFEITFLPQDGSKDFVPAKVKVNVSDSSKPFLSTLPGFGISLSTQENSSNTSEKIQLKVLSQDGMSEFTSIPPQTQVTATISDPVIANLGGAGISSVTGTLATQFTVNAVKAGQTTLNFSINFPDVLPVSIPIDVSGTPSFANTPIDTTVLANLSSNGIELSDVKNLDSTSFSLEDLRLSSSSPLFPVYVPVNLQSSVDSSNIIGLFTIRPIFGVDLLTAKPRTLVNNAGTDFKSPLLSSPSAIGGITPSDTLLKPIALIATSDGIRSLTFEDSSSPINSPLAMLSAISDAMDVDLFEFGNSKDIKIAVLKGNMILLLDGISGEQETSASLSGSGFEQELTTVDNQTAAVVSVGSNGIDLVFPITNAEPRVVNFKLSGNTKSISVVEKLSGKSGPFVIAYDGSSTLSIVNLLDVNAPISTIETGSEKISEISYAGKFTVNGKLTDVLIATTQRNVLLFDLNNLVSIPASAGKDFKIKNNIEDLIAIDGIAYLALGQDGILALSIGSLLDGNSETPAVIANFKKNKLAIIKTSGAPAIISKSLNASKLASSKPFLLSSGPDNNLTVMRVSP